MQTREFVSARHHLADNLFWYGVSMVANFAARFVSIGILWRAIGGSPDAGRHYAWLSVAVALVMILADAGLESSVVRFFGEDSRFYRVIMALFRRATLFIALPSVMLLSIGWYYYTGTLDGLWAGIAGFGFALFQIAAALYRSHSLVNQYALWNTVRNLLITLAVWALHNHFHVLSVGRWFSVYGIVSIGVATLMNLRARPNTNSADRMQQDMASVRAYALPLYLCALILWLQGFVDKGFLSLFHKDSLPPFQLLLDYSLFFGTVALLINRAWPTVFFTLARKKSPAASDLGRTLVVVHGGAAVAALATLLFGPTGIRLLAGHPFVSPHGMLILAIMLFGETIGIFSAVVRPEFEYHRRTSWLLWAASIAVAVNIVGNALLVPPLSMLGASITTAVSLLVLFWILFAGQQGILNKPRTALHCALVQLATLAVLVVVAR